jgi:allophanate hydrolase subunit 2
VTITPGATGNYGYVRFDHEIGVAPVLGSRSTNCTVGLGGWQGRALLAGDELSLLPATEAPPIFRPTSSEGPIRVIWGLHADLFPAAVRQRFLSEPLAVSSRLDRMGVRLDDAAGIFADMRILTLVSDAVVAGDIQILGDGTPIVLMRDHQPTGGYPRIATIISADLDRFAQMRPGSPVTFQSVSPRHAHAARAR